MFSVHVEKHIYTFGRYYTKKKKKKRRRISNIQVINKQSNSNQIKKNKKKKNYLIKIFYVDIIDMVTLSPLKGITKHIREI